jgi:hypothetical protein
VVRLSFKFESDGKLHWHGSAIQSFGPDVALLPLFLQGGAGFLGRSVDFRPPRMRSHRRRPHPAVKFVKSCSSM